MSYDIALNRISHDIQFTHAVNNIQTNKYRIWFIDGADRVAQQIKINLLSLLGEWFLDNRYGVPYLEEILIKNPRIPSVETILRNHINSIPDVVRINSISLNWNRQTRILGVEFSCETNLGPIQESVNLEVLPRVSLT